MNFLEFNIWVLLTGVICTGIGIIFWFIKKKEKIRIWFPILKIFPTRKLRLLFLTWTRPPLVPFICFVLGCLVLLFLILSPYQLKYNPVNRSSTIHILVDMSSSVQASIDIEGYKRVLKDIVSDLFDRGHSVEFYTSYKDKYSFSSENEATSIIDKLEFHTPGIDISRLIQYFKINSGILLIVSDSDFHSWKNFEKSSFSNNIIVKKINLEEKSRVSNIYFEDVSIVERKEDKITLAIKIVSSNPVDKKLDGVLKIFWDQKLISKLDWSIAKDNSVSSLEFELKLQDFKKDLNTNILNLNELKFELDFNDKFNKGINAVNLDDIFWLKMDVSFYKALLVSETSGERSLDDPMYFLQKALSSLNFSSKRVDSVKNENQNEYSLIISEIGDNLERFCPDRSTLRESQSVWFVPDLYSYQEQSSYVNLCWCIAYLTNDKVSLKSRPSLCSDIKTIKDISMYLKHTGGTEIGGSYGDDSNLAWKLKKYLKTDEVKTKDNKSNQGNQDRSEVSIISYLIPLVPMNEVGMDHAKFPLFIEYLIKSLNLNNLQESSSLRIDDISQRDFLELSSEQKTNIFKYSNVPIEESQLKKITEELLQEVPISGFSSFVQEGISKEGSLEEVKDSSRVVVVCNLILILLLGIEIFFYWQERIKNKE